VSESGGARSFGRPVTPLHTSHTYVIHTTLRRESAAYSDHHYILHTKLKASSSSFMVQARRRKNFLYKRLSCIQASPSKALKLRLPTSLPTTTAVKDRLLPFLLLLPIIGISVLPPPETHREKRRFLATMASSSSESTREQQVPDKRAGGGRFGGPLFPLSYKEGLSQWVRISMLKRESEESA